MSELQRRHWYVMHWQIYGSHSGDRRRWIHLTHSTAWRRYVCLHQIQQYLLSVHNQEKCKHCTHILISSQNCTGTLDCRYKKQNSIIELMHVFSFLVHNFATHSIYLLKLLVILNVKEFYCLTHMYMNLAYL